MGHRFYTGSSRAAVDQSRHSAITSHSIISFVASDGPFEIDNILRRVSVPILTPFNCFMLFLASPFRKIPAADFPHSAFYFYPSCDVIYVSYSWNWNGTVLYE